MTVTNKLLFAVVSILMAGTVSAGVPLFAAKCPSGITAGVSGDITPRSNLPPRVTSTARDSSFGECEIASFKSPGTGTAEAGAAGGQAIRRDSF
jgi:hypothetical protein